ncbi:MAG: amidase family protein, partial [Actinomycetota bacterium]|nr:amidase family protein [Actinomycetota bacterium]
QQAPLEAPLQQLASPRYRPDVVALQQLEIERSRLYERVDHLLRTYDVIITPTVLSDPPSAETVIEADWWTHLAVANFTGHPAVSIPCGFTELGLPIGLQAIGRWDADQQILDLADRIHSLHPWSES